MNILVISGGTGSEREISLKSGAAVRDALTGLGHNVAYIDAAESDAAVVAAAAAAAAVFPIIHGTGGEDGQIQKLLDRAGTPYLGSGAIASELCFEKPRLLARAQAQGVTVPRGEVVDAVTFAQSNFTHQPFVLKPIADGSTVGCMIVRRLPFDQAKAAELLASYGHMLVEELVAGIELTVPVLDHSALPVIQIVPPSGEEFDYTNKYNGATAELCPPRDVAIENQERAQQLAVQVHNLAGCRHLSRTDIILRPNGELVLLEINTMPGMTSQSLYPKAAAAAGLSWRQLVARLLELVVG